MPSLLRNRWRRDQPGEYRALRSPLPVSQTLEGRAVELARAMVVSHGRRAGRSYLSSRLLENARLLERAYRGLGDDVRRGEFIESGAEWLLDNFHVVTVQLRHIQRDLPPGFYRRLPALAGRRHRGRARVEAMAVELIRYCDSRLDRAQLIQFLTSFQTVAPLTIGELWAWPSALKLALVESLRRLAEDLLDARTSREQADQYLARLDTTPAALSQFERTSRSSTFVAQVLHRSREYGERGGAVRGVVEEYLASEDMNAEEAIRSEHRRQAVTQVSLANAVMSLRLCAELDWADVVEAISLVDEALRRDPAGAYARMDFLSRDRQRRAVESLAPVSGSEQVDVALTAVELAREATARLAIGERETHVGYYLIDRGRRALEQAIGHRISPATRWRRFWRRHSTFAYLSAVGTFTLLFTMIPVLLARQLGGEPAVLVLTALALLIPATEVAIFLVNRWVTAVVNPRRLLRLEFKGNIPPSARTMVVIPTLFTSVEAVETMLEHLEVLALGNLDPSIHFAILSDLADAPAAEMPGDDAIVEAARTGIERLTRDFGDDKFFLFHRERLWNPAEQRWMGWERKRGKLEELNRLLRGATDTSYTVQVGRLDRLQAVKYCLTLDSDTKLPRDAAKSLIGIIEHPLNRPRIDPQLGRVTEGYGILQPRVSVTMASAAGSLFARLYAGHTGVDPYTTAVSDVYQDVFDEGIFTGKGLYDVDAFITSLENRVPENSLLSHDLFEGVHARTALVSDVEVVDDYPSSVLTYARRQHRWVRGDWQILRWLLPVVPARYGHVRNHLSLISRWKILDNLRRSLVPPTTLLVFALGWALLPGPAWVWTLIGLIPIAIPAYSWLIEATRGRTPGEPWRVFWRTMVEDLGTALARIGLQLTFLAQTAWDMAHAVVVTLVRMAVTHRRLLEWETAAASAGRIGSGTPRVFWIRMIASPVAAVCGTLVVSVAQPGALPVALPILALWGVAPLIALLLSRPIVVRRPSISAGDRMFLLEVARRTWRYFERFSSEAEGHLPPDNVQMLPEQRIARRTSPTNVGLGLVSVVAARELGFIDTSVCLDRLEASLVTIEKLERHSGHLLNWYDTETGEPLRPRYISTVDSGNFVGSLIAVQGALRTLTESSGTFGPRIDGLVARLETLVAATDFRMLYHETRGLFTIGYRLPDPEGPGGPDPSYYDLLASEARVASFIAIAKGDVPQAHWFRLGRALTSFRGSPVLLSWSASMFEYLMPLLFQRLYPATLLAQSSYAVVERQIRYGGDRGVPWGVSESAYSVVDRHGTYQYKAFGIPGLGLKRGLADELVVAPYATALASMIQPAAGVANLRRLAQQGLFGEFGFYDALDYTARTATDSDTGRTGDAIDGHVVPSYFAHHAGMTLAALANVLADEVVVSWFHQDPRVQATELLLQERVPRQAAAVDPRPLENIRLTPSPPPPPVRRVRSPHTAYPHAQFLSNGDCISVVTHAGGGHLRFKDICVTRSRPDPTQDPGSQYIYLRDVRESTVWSATYQPTAIEPDDYGVTMGPDGVRFYRRDGDLTTRLDVAVSSEDDVEVRMLVITNTGARTRELDMTTYVELALSPAVSDLAHPAFGKLFIQTEALPDIHSLLAHRRPRHSNDSTLWAFHVLSQSRATGGAVEWDTDRARFIGRGQTLRAPAALDGRALSSTDGLVLDPIFSLRQRIRLRPGGSARFCISTGVSPDRQTAHGLAHKYHQFGNARQAFMQAATDEHARLRHLDILADDALLFDRLASRVLYEDRSLRAEAGLLASNTLGQPGLWRFAISGDLPILMVRVSQADDTSLVRDCLQAQEYWRLKGLVADLVVINEHPPGYVDEVHAELTALLDRGPWRTARHRPGGAYLLRADEMTPPEQILVASIARAVLDGSEGGLRVHLDRPYVRRSAPPPVEREIVDIVEPAPAAEAPVPALRFAHERGGFTEDGREYVITLEGDRQTPLPWVNVIASPGFGTIVSESGSAHTWAINSRENRLTPFANDPITDPTTEAWFIRDNESGAIWCPTPGPVARDPHGRVVVSHGAGCTRFSRVHAGIGHTLEVSIDMVAPVKIQRLTITNHTRRSRRLMLCAYAEWLLGPPVARGADPVMTVRDESTGAVFATRAAASDFSGRVAFSALSTPVVAVTGDRRSFLGRHGSPANPAALRAGTLDNRVGAGLDPCAALQSDLTLKPGETVSVVWVLGQAADPDEARRLITDLCREDAASLAIARTREFWDDLCTRVQVVTPDDSFDVMMNRWLLYQTVSCRLWARSGYHQPGGAFGFRDQLQDVLALLTVQPEMTREHILRAAGRQFVEGDVQHWWHEPSGRGLRTRCSDDMLWLPFAVIEYTDATGDLDLLDAIVPFLEGPLLGPGEDDVFGEPRVSSDAASIYEHCVRAIARGVTVGSHGLPLMGAGDWNDGMNRVGEAGRGESTWLGFFLHSILRRFAPIARGRGEHARAEAYDREATRLSEKLELAWDGDWFRRGYYDDGTPLGSAQSDECKIDAISQSWAVLSGAVPARQAERAMDAVRERLIQRSAGVILLLDPPFDRSAQQPGYIKAYPPGVRENGGQYTHAATWTVMAIAALGYGDEAVELFHMINPVNRTRRPWDVTRYKLEPYVMAGDVYSRPPHAGRGGWSWYTGSSGWMFRLGLEHILGIRRRGDRLEIDPCIPASWPEFSVHWKHGNSEYQITVRNPDRRNRGVAAVLSDGKPVDHSAIPLVNDGAVHRIDVQLGEQLVRKRA